MENNVVSYEYMYNSINQETLDINMTSKNIVQNPTPLKDCVNENYNFINKNIFFKIFSFLFYTFAFIILYPILWIMYLPKVKGRKNLKKVKKAVFVANHTFILDSAVINTHVLKFKRPYLIADRNNLRIPVVKTMIRLFRAVPIPSGIKAYKKFLTSVDSEIKNNKSILIYPEGSMWPYYPRIRPFNSGAFRFAIKNDAPIIPICVSFRKPNWLYRFLGKKAPLININILEPVYPDKNNDYKTEENRINNLVYENINNCFTKTNSYVYFNKKKIKPKE